MTFWVIEVCLYISVQKPLLLLKLCDISPPEYFIYLFYVFVVCCCLQGSEGDETVAMAMAAPDRFVLKPQREGGGTIKETYFINEIPHAHGSDIYKPV